ncbi:MAG: 6-carboxytetrahydropterin synthase, partial [Dehalococcoidia bacterium]|nr:6-carboxytetrahydropterin synthase [Dehalococcoidia bacterium]
MKVRLWTLEHSFLIDAAHYLPQLPVGHKCRNVHGHTWKFTVYVQAQALDADDFVIDFKMLKTLCENYIVFPLDHQTLNSALASGRDGEEKPFVPTCENLACWAYQTLQPYVETMSHATLLSVKVTE